MKKRFLLGNLIYYLDESKHEKSIVLINLINFRRQKVNKDYLSTIIKIEHKIINNMLLSDYENSVLNDLYCSKQVLQNDIISEVEQTFLKIPELHIDKFKVSSLSFNLTHQCNFNCLYCYQNKYKNRSEYMQFMTIKDIDLIKEYLSQSFFDTNKIENIVLSGGESLLPQNIDTINYILKNFKSDKFTIYTNGVNLYEYRKYIEYNLIEEYQVSLDGTAEIIEKINQNSDVKSFEKIINGIKYIESLNKKITIVVMWTRDLEQYVDEFIDLLKQYDLVEKPNIKIRVNLIKDDYNSTNSINNNFYDLNYLCNTMI